MCANCLSQAEVVAGQVALAAAVLKQPAHRLLAELGLVVPPDPVARDVRTVAFLRGLDLEPVAILGADLVDRADAWVPSPATQEPRARAAASAWPIGSQSLLATQ
jgi:hypothetical protein